MSICWECFDADKPNPKVQEAIKEYSDKILAAKGVEREDLDAVRLFVNREIQQYQCGSNPEANKTIGIDIFRPHEFDSITSYDESLCKLLDWLKNEEFDWKQGSRTVQDALNASFSSVGKRAVKGGREKVILDNLVAIGRCRVAVEIETSKNLDNGYWTLRQVLRERRADYGVMIVPWTAKGTGRANEGMALGRLDREFNGVNDVPHGPIYRIAIIRQLDVYRLILQDSEAGSTSNRSPGASDQ